MAVSKAGLEVPMKKEGTIGAAAFLAIAALVGITLQTGTKQGATGRTEQVTSPPTPRKTLKDLETPELRPGCRSIEEQLQQFLPAQGSVAPRECYELDSKTPKEIPKEIADRTSKLKFVIATLPDPIHTHQAVLFDQFTAAIQDAAQDEQYDFDSSWLPWDDGPASYALLADQEKADSQKESREQQPGIFLFRSAGRSRANDDGLVVFVVAEDATHGIYEDQFRNALAWVGTLEPEKSKRRLAILGPTFSGSFASLTQLLADQKTAQDLNLESRTVPLDIYSGSVSSYSAAADFQQNRPKVAFHSFVQNDDAILDRFCDYMKWQPGVFKNFAILSEDETAYGNSGVMGKSDVIEKSKEMDQAQRNLHSCAESAEWLYYPKDISALRGAYQTKSIFDFGAGSSPDAQRRSLPTDLADPASRTHDSIRSYGSNQTPLVQEAFMLEIVAALRDLHVHYILLRGSNVLDQLFLANFLRSMYPSGRIVILSSDLLFIRERGATGLNGAMTLTTYPLFPLTRDWTEDPNHAAAERTFSSDTSEGTYIAFRVLLNSQSLKSGEIDNEPCHLTDDASGRIFVPPVACNREPIPNYWPIPDYSAPYWIAPVDCTSTPACNYPGPSTWLTVIGVNRFWPIASLKVSPHEPEANKAATKSSVGTTGPDSQITSAGSKTPAAAGRPDETGRKLEIPPGMKMFFAVLFAFTFFHAWCCWRGSYTAKPNFRAHFASSGDWRHEVLVFSGSSLLAFMAIVAAWGCGAFYLKAYRFTHPAGARVCVFIVCLVAWFSIIGRIATVWRLSEVQKEEPASDAEKKEPVSDARKRHWIWVLFLEKRPQILRASTIFLAVLAFIGLHALIAEFLLDDTDRALTYWRAMHLSSGVSPIVSLIVLLAGLYLWFWCTLHGLALFGSDRPRLPLMRDLKINIQIGEATKKERGFLRMFSQPYAARKIEKVGRPLAPKTMVITAALFVVLLGTTLVFAGGVFPRGLVTRGIAWILMPWLIACISLQLIEAWQLFKLWQELRSLLIFLDRLALRRTLATMRGISWRNVWRMGGNVLEVRYKVISRQLESMNHSIASLENVEEPNYHESVVQAARDCLPDLEAMREAGFKFAVWYQHAYTDPNAGDLTAFKNFQCSVAKATGTLLSKLLIPAWRNETQSLIVAPREEKDAASTSMPLQADEEHVRNAEEFVCLTYLGFIQNILGRLRTLATTIMVLFIATTIALSIFPYDPRQVLSAILIVLFVILGTVVVKVYAEMHHDATLSHVTNTKPGALDTEFWFKVLAFGFAPLVGLLTRIFPGISDFIFAWIQPSISSLK
jgi:hypothetical protein